MSNPLAAGDQVEQMFVQFMMGELRKSMPDSLMGGQAADMFGEIFDEAFAEQMRAGEGLGLADTIRDALVEQGHGLAVPIPGATVTSELGFRIHPISGEAHHHDGVDFAAPTGTEVGAVGEGRVIHAGDRGGYGRTVVVEHADGMTSLYAHLSEIDVVEGEVVRPGQRLGAVGETGTTTGPHLHLEVRQDHQPIDPIALMRIP
ncbi:MAG: peptidoglycan DD-metalloendopeptidase family protein [Proteobacteria bacterium]|nr:peptidoglycan DD-metalloendopeptidase family protein [Pseudomonadota bacterium]MCP4921723.1 peptidoglycan DD-metalloendopeptidase family protein [Pseudomonadota bacterium]